MSGVVTKHGRSRAIVGGLGAVRVLRTHRRDAEEAQPDLVVPRRLSHSPHRAWAWIAIEKLAQQSAQLDPEGGAAIRSRREASRSVLEAFATGSFDVYDEVLAPDFVDHDPQNPFAAGQRGPQLMRAAAILYRTAFPDLLLAIEDQHEAGDVVISRWTVSGTQMGALPGLPPTRRRATVGGVQIDHFEGDKIVEGWRYWDTLGMLQQLGALPTPRAPAA